ncbi:amidohydrolase [Gephyromycinifex aptenodytis]|uniref:amidohydrolase n=1 Tax=Gephyromycinifex aptenodytis TaxID=2716227 RepID=UPI0014470D79|nr:amidohydrolase [Gephyromycinifex aptenodytis]
MASGARAGRVLAGSVLTPAGVVHEAEVAWDDEGIISYVGPVRGPLAADDIDAAGQVVIPGLVNAHTHSAMTLLRGYSDDCDLHTWLAGIRSFEMHLSQADIVAGLRLALVEMIRSGVTTFADMYAWDAALLDEVIDSGLRVLAAPTVFDHDSRPYPSASPLDGRGVLALTEELAAQYAGHPQVRLAFGPHAPYTCPPQVYEDIAERATRLGLIVHTHVAETAVEINDIQQRYGASPVAHLRDLGLFEVQVLAAHCVHVDEADIATLAAAGVGVAYNPVSNLKLGAGIAPLRAMRRAGVRLGLGTDSVASNNTLDMFEEIKVGALIQRGLAQDATAARGVDLFAMATHEGAAAVGFPEVGALEPGRAADLVVLRTDGPHATPMHSVLAYLAFAARASDVRDVVVGGRRVLADGVVLTLDEDAVRAHAAAVSARLAGDAQAAEAVGEHP